ncbi:hypothetical protein, partial [Methylomicrobium sp. Wu6]|uniref:hypothetical protein n=1 Tax=Methylomicrobium sp. Wu6 TaxID=3107928 RepID=UPI002DD644DC
SSHLRRRIRTASRHILCCFPMAFTLAPEASNKIVSARSRSCQSDPFLTMARKHASSFSDSFNGQPLPTLFPAGSKKLLV